MINVVVQQEAGSKEATTGTGSGKEHPLVSPPAPTGTKGQEEGGELGGEHGHPCQLWGCVSVKEADLVGLSR